MPLDQATLEQLKSTIRRFVERRLIPLEAEVADTDAIPDYVIQDMRDLGLFGLSIPVEYGGLGLTMAEEVEVVFEFGRAAPAFRSVFGTNVGIGSQAILMDGTPEQKSTWLPQLASGQAIGAFCLTEPDAGSDAGSVRTKAAPDGDGFVLNGTKRFITNAAVASVFTVFARTDPTTAGGKGVSAFVVDAATPGIELGPPYKKMGQQGAPVCDVHFVDCRIPGSALLGGPERLNRGFGSAMKTLSRGRLHMSALCCGIAERLIEESVHYALDRKQFGQPLADFQMVQAMLAESRAEAFAAWALVRETAARKDQGTDIVAHVAASKLFASEMVGRVADRAVQIHGGAGYMRDYAVERFYRDVRLFRIYEGTSQIQQLVIAREMMRDWEARN